MKWRFDERAFNYRLKNICSIFNFEIKVGNRWMSRGNEETIVWEREMKKKKRKEEREKKKKDKFSIGTSFLKSIDTQCYFQAFSLHSEKKLYVSLVVPMWFCNFNFLFCTIRGEIGLYNRMTWDEKVCISCTYNNIVHFSV